ncbi:MAG: hypothetical protein KKC20_08790 [Proteobacteria bacterium]|nr:hypothetical protein [Pseudomonadota bacterium]
MSPEQNHGQTTTGHRLPTFPNRRAVFLELEKAGYQVSPAKLYRDFEKGLIVMEPDGSVLEVEVRAYALTNLSKGDATLDDVRDIQGIKSQKECDKLDEQIARLRFDREKEEGKYIPRKDFESELAARGAVLESGFRHLFQRKVWEWITLVGGKPEKSADFLEALNHGLDEELNRYSSTEVFQVIFLEE